MPADDDLLGADAPEFLRAREVAAILRTTEPALTKRRARGDPPSWFRDGKTILYPAAALHEYLAAIYHPGSMGPDA